MTKVLAMKIYLPCVNEPTTQPELATQETLGRNPSKKGSEWKIKSSIRSDIDTITATSNGYQYFEQWNRNYIRRSTN